jgi:hypothetical protein
MGCNHCSTLFFNGFFPQTGKCAGNAGGGHVAQSFPFVIPHFIFPSITLRATTGSDGGLIEVSGVNFTPGSPVEVNFIIDSGGGPTTHQTGSHHIVASDDNDGHFFDAIKVNLSDVSRASVGARDGATGTMASASI